MLLLATLAQAEPLYVQATTLALRDAPTGSVEGWLHINTPVEVLDEEGQMVRIRLADRPDEHPVEGWVAGTFLGLSPLTHEQAQRAASTARRLGAEDQAEAWRERRDALAPGYDWADETPIEVAVCLDGAAQLLGTWDGEDFEASQATALELSGHRWVRKDGASWRPVDGSPFIRPFQREVWNADPSPFGSAWGDGGEVATVLGPCSDEEALYLSRPLKIPEATAPEDLERVGLLKGRLDFHAGGWSTDRVTQADHAIDIVASNAQQTAWLSNGPFGPFRVTVESMHYEPYPHGPMPLPQVHRVESESGTLVVIPWGASHRSGAHVFVMGRRSMEQHTVELSGSGC